MKNGLITVLLIVLAGVANAGDTIYAQPVVGAPAPVVALPEGVELASDGYPKDWGHAEDKFWRKYAYNEAAPVFVLEVYTPLNARDLDLYKKLKGTYADSVLAQPGRFVKVSSQNYGINAHTMSYTAFNGGGLSLAEGDLVVVLVGSGSWRYGRYNNIDDVPNPAGQTTRVVQLMSAHGTEDCRVRPETFSPARVFDSTPECLSKIDTATARRIAIETWNITAKQ